MVKLTHLIGNQGQNYKKLIEKFKKKSEKYQSMHEKF